MSLALNSSNSINTFRDNTTVIKLSTFGVEIEEADGRKLTITPSKAERSQSFKHVILRHKGEELEIIKQGGEKQTVSFSADSLKRLVKKISDNKILSEPGNVIEVIDLTAAGQAQLANDDPTPTELDQILPDGTRARKRVPGRGSSLAS